MIDADISSLKLKVSVARDRSASKLGKLGTFERRIFLGAAIGVRAIAIITKETDSNELLVENRLCEVLEKDISDRGSLASIYRNMQCKPKSRSLSDILMNY
jgi:hypothetical protein